MKRTVFVLLVISSFLFSISVSHSGIYGHIGTISSIDIVFTPGNLFTRAERGYKITLDTGLVFYLDEWKVITPRPAIPVPMLGKKIRIIDKGIGYGISFEYIK